MSHVVRVEKGGEVYYVRITTTKKTKGMCETCDRKTRRNRYGILHDDCSRCRYLKMIYGQNIRVH